jgi:hypothetical protein
MLRKSRIATLILIFLLSNLTFAKTKGISITTGFIKDTYGISFYYDEDNYYNDGWHLIDDNGDGMYEYYYFSLSGHMLKDAIAPNGYQLNQDGKLIINNKLYQVQFIDVANSNVAIFLNKKESVDELVKGFETDYNQVFNEWYIKSKADITSHLNVIASNLTVQKVNKVRDEISRRVKECKKIGVWYNERLYSAKKTELINKDTHKILSRKLQKDMSEYINRFREEMGNIIKSMGY